MPSNVAIPTIRFANQQDASEILEIYGPIIETTTISFEYHVPSVEAMQSRMFKSQERHAWIVLEWGNELAGYAYSSDFRARRAYRFVAEVSVYVHEKHRRKSVAKMLYDALHNITRLQGYCATKAVMTHPNPPSVQFHRHVGYAHEGIIKNAGFKFDQWHDIEIMHLQLKDDLMPYEIIPTSELDEQLLQKIFNQAVR